MSGNTGVGFGVVLTFGVPVLPPQYTPLCLSKYSSAPCKNVPSSSFDWLYLLAASFALLNNPSLLNTKLMLTPAKINNTIMVTTRATNVIPFSFSLSFNISFSL